MTAFKVAFYAPLALSMNNIMRSGWIEFLLCHPNIVVIDDALGILQLIFPALGRIIAHVGDVHHIAEDAIGIPYPHLVADDVFGIVLLAMVLVNAPIH